MPRTPSEAAIVALAVALAAGRVDADDKLTSKLTPRVSVASSIAKTQLETSIERVWNNISHDIGEGPAPTGFREHRLRFFARVPVDGDDSTTARLDRSTATARLGAKLTLAWSNSGPGEDHCGHQLAIAAEFGVSRFEYFPTGNKDVTSSDTHQSGAVELEYRKLVARTGGLQLVPQLRVRWARDWKPADKIGVVIPGVAPKPDTVKDLILDPPGVAPETSVRFAMPFTFGSEFGFGPSLKYTLTGDKGDYLPGDKVQRARGEWFFYWFPSDLKAGGRIGIGPYVDYRVSGADDLHETEYGALVDLRLGAKLLDY